jgi:hypothetical protein
MTPVPILFGTKFAPHNPGKLRSIDRLALDATSAHNLQHGIQIGKTEAKDPRV